MQQTDIPVMLNARHTTLEPVAIDQPGFSGLHAWRVKNQVGEAPSWCEISQCLYWIDVRAPAIHRLHPASGRFDTWQLPEVVGAMGLAAPDTVVVALKHSLALIDLQLGRLVPLASVVAEPAHNRLNDGKVSPSGRWFVFGSMDDSANDKQATGALYCADRAGTVHLLHSGLTVANGIAFSPDGCTLYFSDSYAGSVWLAPWDEGTGAMGLPLPFCASNEADGRPDGAAVDENGCYWSAGVSAACLNRFSPHGKLLDRLKLPVRAPTMPCFGGTGLSDLYLTSLVRPGWVLDALALDGALLVWPSAVRGLSAPRWV